jgi:putative GTP pyrophosphokinase
MLNEQILTDYSAARARLVALGAQLEVQLQGLVVAHALPAQFVTHRIKSLESLRRKVSRPDRSYRRLWDLTDLVGLRVAAYFEDTLEPLARLIEGHFAVDFTHSTDKQRFTEDARFGYRSLHYVCALPEGPDPYFRFEIQLRTVLQHAWAEVEHDLGYQAANAVPERIKRRFSRIASLLEIADQEFGPSRASCATTRRPCNRRSRGPARRSHWMRCRSPRWRSTRPSRRSTQRWARASVSAWAPTSSSRTTW